MNRAFVTFLAVVLVTALAVPPAFRAPSQPGKAPVDNLVKGNATFAVKLYRELAASKGYIFTPGRIT